MVGMIKDEINNGAQKMDVNEFQNIEQGSDAWKKIRAGKVTASRVKDIVATTKSGYSTSRDKYMTQLLLERLTNSVAESYSNDAMAWGTEQEPFARAAYESKMGVLVDEVAFVNHPTIEQSGASPDGIVGEGLVELKCPMSHTHLEIILGGLDDQYKVQVNWQMACTGAKWTDLCSFDPRFPAELQLVIKRFERDDAFIATLEKEVIKFLAELDDKLNKVKSRG
jgi:putative phage-type endonuclease